MGQGPRAVARRIYPSGELQAWLSICRFFILGPGDEDASAFQFLKYLDLEVGDGAFVSVHGLGPWECRIRLDCCGRRCEEF